MTRGSASREGGRFRQGIVGLVVVVSACSGGTDTVRATSPSGVVPWRFMVEERAERFDMLAEIQGVVRIDMATGCFLLGDVPIVWPFGTTFEQERVTVHLPDGRPVRAGDTISAGGGEIDDYLPDDECGTRSAVILSEVSNMGQ